MKALSKKLTVATVTALSLASGSSVFAHGGEAAGVLGILTTSELTLTTTCGLNEAGHHHHYHHRRHQQIQKLMRAANDFIASEDADLPAALHETLITYERETQADASIQGLSAKERVELYVNWLKAKDLENTASLAQLQAKEAAEAEGYVDL